MDPSVEQPPLFKVLIGGGIAGGTADFIVHGLDTVKTRLQGQPYPPKYLNLSHTFRTLIKEEGIKRGLYGGIQPAMVGSVCGTMIYFGAYEGLKRRFEAGISYTNKDGKLKTYHPPPTASHLASAGVGELIVSLIYVPSEVIKTRMQLQGRYNNPHFVSGYNYASWISALKTIIRNDGVKTLYRGYQATLLRDVPCTSIQFAIYEKLQSVYRSSPTKFIQSDRLDFLSDMAIGGIAGAIAGGLTTPLDVVKTVLQTQQDPDASPRRARPRPAPGASGSLGLPKVPTPLTLRGSLLSMSRLPPGGPERAPYAAGILDGLQQSYRTYGVQGLFRGLAPRVAWTGFQSAILFLVYEQTIELLSR